MFGIPITYQVQLADLAIHTIDNTTVALLQSWQYADYIANMVFETTASNTGHLTVACVSTQQSLNRPVLWSACIHYMGEVVRYLVMYE